MILNRTNHLWVTQEVFNICLRKMLEMEMTAWLEEHRRREHEAQGVHLVHHVRTDSNTGCRRTASW